MITAVLRSVIATGTTSTTARITSFTKVENFRSWPGTLLIIAAMVMITTSFVISDGCSVKLPTPIHRLDSFISTPIPGRKTAISNRNVMM